MTYSPNFVGNSSSAISTNTGDIAQNATGSTLIKGTPVRLDINGKYQNINVSVSADVLAIVGLMIEDTANTIKGASIAIGRIEDVVLSATFGESVYLSKSGGLTNTSPSIGIDGFVSGDFVVRLGIVFKNEIIITQKDLYLNIAIIGQL